MLPRNWTGRRVRPLTPEEREAARTLAAALRGRYYSTLHHVYLGEMLSLAGSVVVNVSRGGQITGSFRFYSRTYRLSGALGPDGTFFQSKAETTPDFSSTTTTNIGLKFTVQDTQASVTGGFGQLTSALGWPPSYKVAPAGRHSFVLPDGISASRLLARFTPATTTTVPHGIGFATGALRPSAHAFFAGRLPDGAPFSTSVPLIGGNRFCLWVHGRQPGSTVLNGTLELAPEGGEFVGTPEWYRYKATLSDPPFATSLDARIAPYTRPASGSSIFGGPDSGAPKPAALSFALPSGTPSLPALLGIHDRFSIVPGNPTNCRGQIVRSMGLLTGSFSPDERSRTPFRAAFYPRTNDFAGVLSSGDRAGTVHLALEP